MVELLVVLGLALQPAPPLEESEAFVRLRPSLAVASLSGQPVGSALLIDPAGFFVMHRSTVMNATLDAVTPDGQTFRLQLRSIDEPTQLALLQVLGKLPEGLKPVGLPKRGEAEGTALLGIVPSGPFRADLVSGQRIGILNTSRRLVPLSEVKFELPKSGNVGGALLVTTDGRLFGTLSATLQRSLTIGTPTQNLSNGSPAGEAFRNFPQAKMSQPRPVEILGPNMMTVAYTAGTDVVRQVLEGFLSPARRAEHPAIGLLCRDAAGQGALVMSVVQGGPAALAGVRPNDLLTELGGVPVRNQFDFARAINQQKVGSRLTIRVRRGAEDLTLEATVGVQPS